MKEINQDVLYYRDAFLKEHDLNLSDAVDFAPGIVYSALSLLSSSCSFVEYFYCCEGLGKRCWADPHLNGKWGLTQESVNSDFAQIINEIGDEITGRGRVFTKESKESMLLYIFARDLPGKRDIVAQFDFRRTDAVNT